MWKLQAKKKKQLKVRREISSFKLTTSVMLVK